MSKNFKSRPLFSNTLPKEVKKPKIEWKILPIAWFALKRTAMAIGFLVLFQILIAVIILPALFQGAGEKPFPKEMVLFLPINGDIVEVPEAPSFADPFAPPARTVRQVVDALDAAAVDNRVKGLLVRINDGGIALVHAQEIRDALMRFKASGKFAHVYSSSYGDSGNGLGRYYLASAFDEIWMQPMGIVMINGASAEMPFLRGLMEKVGVEPNMFQRKEYKTAYEMFTNRNISKENKETLSRLLGDIRAEVMRVIPAERGMDEKTFSKLVDKGLFTSSEALDAGLITHADYADVLVGNIKEAVAGDREASDDLFVDFGSYSARLNVKNHNAFEDIGLGGKSKIALVYASGAIVQSEDSGSGVAAAEVIAPAIMDATEDENVKAIVLRVDSPGGSPVASESILRAIEKAKEKGKPVIVSMGSVAASGGYWISAYGDQIFVSPSTITGSIGVVGGKFSLAGLWDKLDVNWNGVQWGKNSGMWSFNEKFSPSEAERINTMLDSIYDAFLERVAKGRKMSVAEVDKIAGGRVWSGARAVEIGLADQIGGLDDALDYTATLLSRKDRNDLNVVVMPKPKTAFEQFLSMIEGQVTLGRVVKENAAIFEMMEPVSGAISQVRNPDDYLIYSPLRAP